MIALNVEQAGGQPPSGFAPAAFPDPGKVRNIQYDDRMDNVKAALARGLPTMADRDWSGRPCIIVGGGPSLIATARELADMAPAANILVSNDAHEFLRERGIPFHGCYLNEVAGKEAKLFDNVLPDVTYYVALQAHPSIFDKLLAKGANVQVWHLGAHGVDEVVAEWRTRTGLNMLEVHGGASAFNRMFNVMTHGWGARDVHLFGFDSSAAGTTHAYENRDNLTKSVWCAGREFRTNLYLMRQAENFIGIDLAAAPEGTTVYPHGDGLLPHMLRVAADPEAHAAAKAQMEAQSKPLPPDSKALATLRQIVAEMRPKLVMEFGSGHSTVAIAEAMKGIGPVISYEQSEHWYRNTLSMLDGRPCNLYRRDAKPVKYMGWPGWSFDTEPYQTAAPDLIYLDGPELTAMRPFADNVLRIEGFMKPGARLVIDKRVAQCALHELLTKRRWAKSHAGDLTVYTLER